MRRVTVLLLLFLALIALTNLPSYRAGESEIELDEASNEMEEISNYDEAAYSEDNTADLDEATADLDEAEEPTAEVDEASNEVDIDEASNEAELDEYDVENLSEADLDDAADQIAEVQSGVDADTAEINSGIDADGESANNNNHHSSGTFRPFNLSLFAVLFIATGIFIGLTTIGYVVFKYRSKQREQQRKMEKEQQGALSTLTAEHVDQPYVLHVL